MTALETDPRSAPVTAPSPREPTTIKGAFSGASELDDLLCRIPLEDLRVRLASLLADKCVRALDGGSRVHHLLAQLLLVERLAQRPNRRPHVDEDSPRPERARDPCARGSRLFGELGAIGGDDDRFCSAARSCY
jgi:hypothetical protein